MNTPSERFKSVRKELGLTQNEFAKELNISQVAVYKLEEGQIKSISQEVTKILEDKFGINKIWLHFGEGMMYLDDTTNMYSVYNKLEYLSKMCEAILAKLGISIASPSGKRGRGRPRKNPVETTVSVVKEKRGRGRPRKNPVAAEVTETKKRGRGRPRKNPVAEVTEKKRGRGRPRKNPIESSTTVKRSVGRPRKNSVSPKITETKKRGRGRPRKNPVTEVTEKKRGRGRPKNSAVKATAATKKSVGRPKKQASSKVESKTTTTPKKRGRGRPKKNA
ncbi:MAG: helix-turn-helix domain-containing protein [bacterium]